MIHVIVDRDISCSAHEHPAFALAHFELQQALSLDKWLNDDGCCTDFGFAHSQLLFVAGCLFEPLNLQS